MTRRNDDGDLVCEKCGFRMRPECGGDMQAHESECDGHDDATRRFEQGQPVEVSDLGMRRLDIPRREGYITVVGSGDHRTVTVQFEHRKTTQGLFHHYLRPRDVDNAE